MNTGGVNMARYSILVCEDNMIMQDILREYLVKENYNVYQAKSGEEALEIIDNNEISLVLLDIMLPGIDGFEVCRRIRSKGDTPIIIVSARGTAPDRVAGLEYGADDYVTKPFSPKEVMLRIRKLLERKGVSGQNNKLAVGELEVFPDANLISIKGKKIEMTNKEMQVLEFLIANKGEIRTRDEILASVWGRDYDGDERVVDTLIKRIRKKISAEDVHYSLSTVYGKGYRIEEQQ